MLRDLSNHSRRQTAVPRRTTAWCFMGKTASLTAGCCNHRSMTPRQHLASRPAPAPSRRRRLFKITADDQDAVYCSAQVIYGPAPVILPLDFIPWHGLIICRNPARARSQTTTAAGSACFSSASSESWSGSLPVLYLLIITSPALVRPGVEAAGDPCYSLGPALVTA